MCFILKRNDKQTKKLVNRFLQDDASAGIRSLQTSIEIKLPKSIERTLIEKTSRTKVCIKVDSHVAVNRYEYDVRSMVLTS